MKPIRILFALMASVFLVQGCKKDPIKNLDTEERRIYITNQDETANFASYNTFSIAENVVVVDGNNSQQQLTPADQAYLDAFRAAMESRGYTQVSKTASPDLGVQVSRIIRTSTGIMSVPDYFGYWDPFYWGSGFGSGFGGWGAPPFWSTTTYQVREGMLAFDIIDLKNATTNNNLKVIWNGMIRGAGLGNASSAPSQVSQLFEQSAYLRK
ncbi:protein of unknown function [Cnuella takakiae]|uniref:DUF4136 domain-containing protein n=1 Tax=Cnuella takakiae TaxID=1302690 RepID=A0A1M5EIH1_9BACT|nr:DUF4136 domain-containing protein [Cnuella takakiae]OLY91182.1 hypothetical protein BUE76_04170 [Cnuella takakiae]SHF78852.1 protein of unknown function [Cnuella takakiae]